MKKIIVFFVLLTAFYAGHAQLRAGVKAGLNVSNIAGGEDYRSKTGLHFGAFANLKMTSNLSVQGELLYSGQGARWDDDNEKTTLNYLQVPLLARYTFAPGFYAEAGPQIGFLLKAEDDDEGDVSDIKEYLKTTDVSLAIGAGYNVTENFGVYARYNAGFVKFYESEKNRTFQFGLSYTFGKAGK